MNIRKIAPPLPTNLPYVALACSGMAVVMYIVGRYMPSGDCSPGFMSPEDIYHPAKSIRPHNG